MPDTSTLSIPAQNLSFNLPQEGKLYALDPTQSRVPTVTLYQGNEFYHIPASNLPGVDFNSLSPLLITGEMSQASSRLGGSGRGHDVTDPTMFLKAVPQQTVNYSQTPNPANPNSEITTANGRVVNPGVALPAGTTSTGQTGPGGAPINRATSPDTGTPPGVTPASYQTLGASRGAGGGGGGAGGGGGGRTYQVQQGDTIGKIAQKLGVQPNQISGYRSGNPNLIYPGENLNVGGSTITPVSSTTGAGGTSDTSIGNTSSDVATAMNDILGAFKSSGITPPNSNISPFSAVMDTYTQFYNQMGLGTIKAHYDDLVKQYADLAKEKQNKIDAVNDNPWISEGLRSKKVASIDKSYEARTAALTKEMTLTDTMYKQGRQEAQFWAGKGLEIAHQADVGNENLVKEAISLAERRATAAATEKRFEVRQGNKGPSKANQLDAQTKIGGFLNGRKGMDGYVSSQDFSQARSAWVSDGFSGADFDKIFSGYVNPSHAGEYGVNFQGKPKP